MAKAENSVKAFIRNHLLDEGWLVAEINGGFRGGVWLNTWHPPKADDTPLNDSLEAFNFWNENRPPYHSGFSDMLALRGGVILFIEAKTKTGKASAMQSLFAHFVKLGGGKVITPKGKDDFLQQYQALTTGEA